MKLLHMTRVLKTSAVCCPAEHKALLHEPVLAYTTLDEHRKAVLLEKHYLMMPPYSRADKPIKQWMVVDRKVAELQLADSRTLSELGWTICRPFKMMEGAFTKWELYGYDNVQSHNLTIFLYDAPDSLKLLLMGKVKVELTDLQMRHMDPQELSDRLGVGVSRVLSVFNGKALAKIDSPDVHVVASPARAEDLLNKYRRLTMEAHL